MTKIIYMYVFVISEYLLYLFIIFLLYLPKNKIKMEIAYFLILLLGNIFFLKFFYI